MLSLLVQAQVNIGRFTNLLNMKPTVTDRPEVIEKYGDCFTPHKENWEPIKGDIEFEHVDFKYPDGDEYILQDFNLKIPFGTNVAIVGETGAGKSTLASLICRFTVSNSLSNVSTTSRSNRKIRSSSSLKYAILRESIC